MTKPFRDPAPPAMFEPLEPRLLLDGNVVVQVQRGDLVIRGDAGNNEILVEQGASADQFNVTGQDTTTVNGRAGVQVFNSVNDDIRIRMRRGDDIVTIDAVDVPDDLRVNTGAGIDVVTIQNGFQIGDDLNINTRGGDDEVISDTATVNDRTRIRTGRGADNVRLSEATIHGECRIISGGGHDVVMVMASELKDLLLIKTGFGEDQLTVNGSTFRARVKVKQQKQNDTLDILGISQFDGPVLIQQGGGDDLLDVENTTFGDDALANGQWGIDTFTDGGGITGTLDRQSYEL